VSVSVSVCVCLSQVAVFYRNEWTNRAGFGTGASFHPSYAVFEENSGISKNKGTSLWNFVPNTGLRKFCFGISIVETCYRLSSTTWRHSERDKLDIVGQLSWQYLRAPTRDHCSWSHAIKLSLQHDSVARVHQRQLIVACFGQRLQRSNSLVWFHACCSLKFALASRA